MKLRYFLLLLLAVPLRAQNAPTRPAPPKHIVVFLADDLGIGDVRAYNPAGKIATPNLDRLAGEGVTFTDAHTPSAVCTPTRYGLLTGRYNWRSRLQKGVLGGLSPRLIEEGRLTLPGMLKKHGYTSAVIGKWHLGLDWVKTGNVESLGIEKPGQFRNVDFAKPFAGGPLTVGFDSFFGIAGSLDMVPYTFLENDRVTALPVEENSFLMHADKQGKKTRHGPAAPGFQAEAVLPRCTERALEFISAKKTAPFFLYLPLNSPHTPIVPTGEWKGRSGLGAYGDFVQQTDAAVGAVLKALDDAGIAKDTLVIFTSDNGCSPEADFPELKNLGHDPSAGFRGTKADLFEGGHRVPFIVRWPARIGAGGRSSQLVCLTDIFSTVAELFGEVLPADAAEDSVSFAPAFAGKAGGRNTLVSHSINGSFAIREGNWKLLLAPDSGGWSAPKPGSPDAKGLPESQLYDLSSDPAETKNLFTEKPEIARKLEVLLDAYVHAGRSTAGAPQKNSVEVETRK